MRWSVVEKLGEMEKRSEMFMDFLRDFESRYGIERVFEIE